MSENKELLEVKDLGITFFTDRGALPAVQEVSFSIKPGETLGVVGESGCGKTYFFIINAINSISSR